MKKVTQQWDDLLLDYLDGRLNESQQSFVMQSLQTDAILRDRYEELKKTNDLMKGMTLEIPAKNFTSTVIARLDETPRAAGLSVRSGLMLLAGIVVIMFVAVVLLSAGVFDQTTTVDLNDVSLTQKFLKQSVPSISIDGKWLVNGIILLNIVIAFLVLDRAVLKPFFQRRTGNV